VTEVARETPDNANGSEVLDCVHRYIDRFVAFPSEEALVAVTLWAAHTHFVSAGALTTTPRLILDSPEKGCGKSRLLEILSLLCDDPIFLSSTTSPAMFRYLTKVAPRTVTFLLDETDQIFKHGKDDSTGDLVALLNSGYRRGAKILRTAPKSHEPEKFESFTPVALAGIAAKLPPATVSRSVVVMMRKRNPATEPIEPFEEDDHGPEGLAIQIRLKAWCELAIVAKLPRPALPNGVVDRSAEVWRPLVAVADAAGGAWPELARGACLALLDATGEREPSTGNKLLEDVRGLLGDRPQISTEALLEGLNALEESPWGTYRGGHPLDALRLRGLLGPYGIKSTDKVRYDKRSVRGYRREDLVDAFNRYLDPVVVEAEQAEQAERAGPPTETTDAHEVPLPRQAEEVALKLVDAAFGTDSASAVVGAVGDYGFSTDPF
jgi:hypothetical protein